MDNWKDPQIAVNRAFDKIFGERKAEGSIDNLGSAPKKVIAVVTANGKKKKSKAKDLLKRMKDAGLE